MMTGYRITMYDAPSRRSVNRQPHGCRNDLVIGLLRGVGQKSR
jgi:hypothetical protein